MPKPRTSRHAQGVRHAFGVAVFMTFVLAFAVAAGLVACGGPSSSEHAADGARYNDDMDVWARAGAKLARHPAVGSWRTNDDPNRPKLSLQLNHDRTGVMHERTSPISDATVTPIKWRTGASGRVTVHRDFGPFTSHSASLTLEVDGRQLRAVRNGAGLRTTDRLIKTGGSR